MTKKERRILIDAIKNVHCSNFDSSPQSVKNEILLIVEALTEDFIYDWTYVKDGLPKENGEYFVIIRENCDDPDQIAIMEFASDLSKAFPYYFEDRKGIAGFFYTDEIGTFEEEDVIAWIPLLELPKEQ